MNIIQITPGAGGMYCGNCFRDNALVGALRRLGHDTVMIPLYLPMTLDEHDNSAGMPIFFGGINVYLQQQSAVFRHMPRWLKHLLNHDAVLRWAAGRAAKTRAEDVGALSISMLRGENGNQAQELTELVGWLRQRERPDVVCLSNALLAGLAGKIKRDLSVPIVCFLQGEDSFLDGLPEKYRGTAWQTLAERAKDIDVFIAPTRYYASLMQRRLGLPPERVQVVFNGMNLDGYHGASVPPRPPVLGFFARMCPEKGLDLLVDAFLLLQRRPSMRALRLHVGGSCGPGDTAFVGNLRARLENAGLQGKFEFFPNVDRTRKQAFYRSLSLLSVPARYGEAFGLYVIEALASGVPVVEPRAAAFPELVEATGGGILVEPENAGALADGIEQLLLDPDRLAKLGGAGRAAVHSDFSMERMAEKLVVIYKQVGKPSHPRAASTQVSRALG